MPLFITFLRAIFADLRTALLRRADPDDTRLHEAALRAWPGIQRALHEFEELFARWKAGTLPEPPPRCFRLHRAPAG